MECEGLAITKYRQALQNGALLLGNKPSNLNHIRHIRHLFVTICQYESVGIKKYRQALQNGELLLGNRPFYLNDLKHIRHLFLTLCYCSMRVPQLQSMEKLWKIAHCC